MQHARDFLGELAEELQFLPTKQEHLLTFRQYGDYLPEFDETLKTEDNYVPGCASATHVICTLTDDGTVTFSGDSQSFISKGYIYILKEAFDGVKARVFITESEAIVRAFIENSGVGLSLIQSRANAFERIYRFMQKKVIEALASTQK